MDEPFSFGNPKVTQAGFTCCGKPRGCTAVHDGCAYLSHPWKRAMVFNDTTARCQATRLNPATNKQEQCSLNHGHRGVCHL